jgi:alkylation response protein AidB-like acyl-CoA dehydrogenase
VSASQIVNNVAELAERFAARDTAAPEQFPHENLRDLREAGVLLAPFPMQIGGGGATPLEAVTALEIVAAASPSTALLLAMPLGLAGLYGGGIEIAPEAHRAVWAEQSERIAADYRAGAYYAACNSEKGAGGSLAATRTVAERDANGSFALSGEKILASFGRHAAYFFSTAKVRPEQLPGCGVVEFFYVDSAADGVLIGNDWDGFGMQPTESHTVRYDNAPARELLGFPDFIAVVQPLSYWYCLFAAIPLGCAGFILRELATPTPASPALRLRLSDALMRYEALRAYLFETARDWRPAAGASYGARVLRAKTYVTQEATKLCAELFALSGGRHYRRDDRLARRLADAFAGTALRPPLPLALDTLVEQFSLGPLAETESL